MSTPNTSESNINSLLKKYGYELLAAFLILMGLLVITVGPRFQLRSQDGRVIPFDRYLDWLLSRPDVLIGNPGRILQNLLVAFLSSQIFAWLLIILGGYILLAQTRNRILLLYPRGFGGPCPKCGEAMERVKRNSWDRVACLVLRVRFRRYWCKNPECGWTSLYW